MVPLENTTDGRIAATLDLFVRYPDQVKICCSRFGSRVRHHLLAKCPQSAEIRRVYSRAQARGQCRNWLSKSLRRPRASKSRVRPTRRNWCGPNRTSAVVASRERPCGRVIEIRATNIEDSPFNETRFARNRADRFCPHREGQDGADVSD